jgi:hypothetical protein
MQTDENKTVDIDTSGPGAEIELEDQQQEAEVEAKEEDSSPSTPDTTAEKPAEEKAEEKVEASDEKPEAKEQKDELKDYSEGVQRRIAKLTKKWREAQRQADEALSYAKLQMAEKEKLQQRYSSVEQAGVKDREERIKSGMQAAAAKLAAAREANDFTAEMEAQKEIARLGYEEARLVESKQMAELASKEAPKEPEMPRIAPQQTETVDPKAEAWGAKNKWFGSDTAMTYTAFDIHNKLEAEGYDASSDEYYAEIDKRIRLEFPHKFGTNEDKAENITTKPTQIVASAKRSVKPGRKTVRLTSSQVAIAKKLGVPLEEYAKQLKITKEV